jgi:hypothetical protein
MNSPAFVGPHEGRELELMLAGVKPMSMFVEPVRSDTAHFPEKEFDDLVSKRKLVKHVTVEKIDKNPEHDIRRVFYVLPGEEWRMNAMLLVQGLYDTMIPGRRPDLERIIGLLLGYDRADIENFLAWRGERNQADPS